MGKTIVAGNIHLLSQVLSLHIRLVINVDLAIVYHVDGMWVQVISPLLSKTHYRLSCHIWWYNRTEGHPSHFSTHYRIGTSLTPTAKYISYAPLNTVKPAVGVLFWQCFSSEQYNCTTSSVFSSRKQTVTRCNPRRKKKVLQNRCVGLMAHYSIHNKGMSICAAKSLSLTATNPVGVFK